jgi:hypothetical protein
MLDFYFRRRKKLSVMKRNPLAPFLEEAADRYHAEGYVHKYAQEALGFLKSLEGETPDYAEHTCYLHARKTLNNSVPGTSPGNCSA